MIKKFYNLGKENTKYNKKFLHDIKTIISSGFYINGRYVERFEKNFSKFNRSKYSIIG